MKGPLDFMATVYAVVIGIYASVGFVVMIRWIIENLFLKM